MRIVLRNGETYEGAPVEIVRRMRGTALFSMTPTVSEYVAFVVMRARLLEDVELNVEVTGKTNEELSKALLDELLRTELAGEAS